MEIPQILAFKESLIYGVEQKIGERTITFPTLGLGEAIGDLRLDDFVVVTAKGGTGKTWLMLQCAYDMATKSPDPMPCAFFSGEMSVEDLASTRLMKLHEGTRYISASASPTEKIAKIAQIGDIPMFFPVIEERWPFRSRCIEVMDYMRQTLGIKMFFFDHMKFFLNEDPLATRSDERQVVEQTVLDIRLYAKKHRTPIFLAVQPKQTAKDEEVTSDSLKGTSAIGQDATVTIVLDRPRLKVKKGTDDDREQVYSDHILLKVEKARHGKGNVIQKVVLNEITGRLEPYQPIGEDVMRKVRERD